MGLLENQPPLEAKAGHHRSGGNRDTNREAKGNVLDSQRLTHCLNVMRMDQVRLSVGTAQTARFHVSVGRNWRINRSFTLKDMRLSRGRYRRRCGHSLKEAAANRGRARNKSLELAVTFYGRLSHNAKLGTGGMGSRRDGHHLCG